MLGASGSGYIMDDMSRFDPAQAPALLRAARDDAGLSQSELASKAGVQQSNLAAIESGRRSVSAELLERLLAAADYRPSIALEQQAQAIGDLAEDFGFRNVRVFGSAARGTDHFTSDIDLLADVDARRRVPFGFGGFVAAVEQLTGFRVDLVLDGGSSPYLSTIRTAAVPL